MTELDWNQCKQYFESRPVFGRLFQKMREKYASLGHLGGYVVLTDVTREEAEQLGGFLQKDYQNNTTIRVSMDLLKKALKNSKFSEFTWEEILEKFFSQPLVIKKQVQEEEQNTRNQFFQEMVKQADEEGRKWLQAVHETKQYGYYILMQQYTQNSKNLETILIMLFRAISNLPVRKNQTKRLAVFAASVTGNPHYFDQGTLEERLFTSFLQFYLGHTTLRINGAEEKNQLFYQAGILKDDLSNYVLTYGVMGLDKNGNLHEGLQGFCERKEATLITLQLLSHLSKAMSQDTANKTIYVVENPSIFSILMEHNPNSCILCTNGQPRLAVFILMDLLVLESTFYYAGDFDPEGLLIAQDLKQRYGKQLKLWNYKPTFYMENLSNVILSEQRLKKLKKIGIKELQLIKQLIEKEKRAVYQEKIFDTYPELYDLESTGEFAGDSNVLKHK